MKKKITALFVALMLVALAMLAFTACNDKGNEKENEKGNEEHIHTFATEWQNDEVQHWHAATCEHTTEKSNVEPHKWDNGKVAKEPTKTEEGEMQYTCTVCKRQKTASIDKLPEAPKYTITFDSMGGSEVQPIIAEAGTKITEPEAPTKEGLVFVGWYESEDGGKTLADKKFAFEYMPQRIFTLYAKWTFTSIKGKTYNKIETLVTWTGTEEEKQAVFTEMGVTEAEFNEIASQTVVKMVFASDAQTVKLTFGNPSDEITNIEVYYKLTADNTILFFYTEEDMKNDILASRHGFFYGATITLSEDKTTLTHTQLNGFIKIQNVCGITAE